MENTKDLEEVLNGTGLLLSILIRSVFNESDFISYLENPETENGQRFASFLHWAFYDSVSNFGLHYIMLGCEVNFRKIILQRNKIYELDLSKEILGGKLLYINYTVNGTGLVPAELHGNSPMKSEYDLHKRLYPIPTDDSKVDSVDVSMVYAYIPENLVQNIPFCQLIEAFQHYTYKEYIMMVIKAQIACEFILTTCLDRYFTRSQIKKNYNTYNKKLNSGLNDINASAGKIVCPQWVVDSLNLMRDIRNEIAHEGGAVQISSGDAANWMKAAYIFYRYVVSIHLT